LSGGVVKLFLEEARGEYKKGAQTVKMPRSRIDTRTVARVRRRGDGEMENPYTYEHDYLVHKCHLQACAMPIDV
jgi:hypothetical protein